MLHSHQHSTKKFCSSYVVPQSNQVHLLKYIFALLFAYWIGIFIYLLLFVILSDIVLQILRLFKLTDVNNKRVKFTALLCAVVCALSLSLYGFCHATTINTKTYDVVFRQHNLSGELNVLLVSDLHLGSVSSEKRLAEMVENINKQNPDVVCVAGDMFDNDYNAIRDDDEIIAVLSKIKSKYGVYVAFGNHDSGKTMGDMIKFVEKCGFILLSEDYVVIDNRFVLVGRADSSPIGGSIGVNRGSTNKLLDTLPEELPVIVIDHNPQNVSEYGRRVDLVLSGHTHKGQILPGNLITSMMYEIDYGYGEIKDGPQLVVTSGFGTWGMPMRVATDSEIVQILID